jgi:hypothetical protein
VVLTWPCWTIVMSGYSWKELRELAGGFVREIVRGLHHVMSMFARENGFDLLRIGNSMAFVMAAEGIGDHQNVRHSRLLTVKMFR